METVKQLSTAPTNWMVVRTNSSCTINHMIVLKPVWLCFCRYHTIFVAHWQQVHQVFPWSHCKVSHSLLFTFGWTRVFFKCITGHHLWKKICWCKNVCVCVCCAFSVTALSMSPVDGRFLSSSLDMTIRFWDLRSPNCQVRIMQTYSKLTQILLTLHYLVHSIRVLYLEVEVTAASTCVFQGLTSTLGKPICSFDPEGLIFAASVDSKSVDLYDLRAYDKVKDKSKYCIHKNISSLTF